MYSLIINAKKICDSNTAIIKFASKEYIIIDNDILIKKLLSNS